jgi:starvation-inducible outer membrane lipoprotein
MKRMAALLFIAIFLAGCVSLPPDTFSVSPEQLNQRQIETRRFSSIKERDLVVACGNVLQDLEFTLENSEVKLGVITANKQRDATNAAEIALAIGMALLGGKVMAVSKDQTIRVSLVVRPALGSNGQAIEDSHWVRVTFQRVVRRTDGSTRTQTLQDEEIFTEFFDRLSKSVFLEAQKI